MLLPCFSEVGRPWNRSSPAVGPCRSPPLPPEDGFKGLLPVPRGLRVPRNSVRSPELGKCSYTKKEQKRALSLSSAVFQPAHARAHTHTKEECAALNPRAEWCWAKERTQANKQPLYSVVAGGWRLLASCSSGRASRGRVKKPAESTRLGARRSSLLQWPSQTSPCCPAQLRRHYN